MKLFRKYINDSKNGFLHWVDAYGDGTQPLSHVLIFGVSDFIEWMNNIILKDSKEKNIIISDDDKVSELSINEKYHLYF